jgi:hypothetical protein
MSYQTPPTQQSATYPQRQTVSISAGTAMKIGFFGAFGALLFSIIVSVVGLVIVLVLGLSLGGLWQSS